MPCDPDTPGHVQKLAVLLLLATTVLLGAQPATDHIFDQNRKLGRGVNVLGYDPIWRSADQARFKASYFEMLHRAGFSSIRMNLHGFRRMDPARGLALPDSWFATVDWALTNAQRGGLTVILDLHEFNTMGADPEANKDKFLAFWRQLSRRYATAPDSVYFELLNEPSRKLTPELWNQYAKEALAIVRENNPRRTVIIGPAYWNSIDHLKELELPENDRNLIVTVHYYKPMEFTHQGASWTDHKDKSGVEWLGNEAEMSALNKDFDKAQQWAKAHNRPLFLGEFGAYDKGPMPSRGRYTAAVARAAEQRGWSWAYWQFDSDFVLYDVTAEKWVEPIRNALVPPK